jgi:hypothetical protein
MHGIQSIRYGRETANVGHARLCRERPQPFAPAGVIAPSRAVPFPAALGGPGDRGCTGAEVAYRRASACVD